MSHNKTNFNVALLFVNDTSGEAQNISQISRYVMPRAEIEELRPSINGMEAAKSQNYSTELRLRHCTIDDLSEKFYSDYE